jgi:hypothetical protein
VKESETNHHARPDYFLAEDSRGLSPIFHTSSARMLMRFIFDHADTKSDV